jgi:hypothetical protein
MNIYTSYDIILNTSKHNEIKLQFNINYKLYITCITEFT